MHVHTQYIVRFSELCYLALGISEAVCSCPLPSNKFFCRQNTGYYSGLGDRRVG